MANGKKNYFRHSFFARNNIKLLKLRDEVGIGFYFYFFSLLELCGEQSADELQEFYEFHDSTIRSLWGVNLKKSERVACVMHSLGLLEFEKREKSFYFKVPNLSKFMGKYTNKKESKGPNKSKENKRKEKKNKAPTLTAPASPDIVKIIDYLNATTGKKFKASTPKTVSMITSRTREGFTVEDFTKVVDVKFDEWGHLPEWNKYLRPETLFGTKFETYLNQKSDNEVKNHAAETLNNLIETGIAKP